MIRLIHTAEGQFFIMNIRNIFKNNAILEGKTPLISSILAGMIVGFCLLGIVMPRATNADFINTLPAGRQAKLASYVAKASNEEKEAKDVIRTLKVVVTAYSSTEDQTDDTPLITASGKQVQDGIVANNMLAFGTKIKIPGLYGDKIFTIQDRMNKRKSDYQFDIWMPSRELALNFGVKAAYIEVLEN